MLIVPPVRASRRPVMSRRHVDRDADQDQQRAALHGLGAPTLAIAAIALAWWGARTGRTSPARNASSPATATIARAAILRTVVAAATAPTRAAPGVAGMD